MLENDADRLALIRAVDGSFIKADLGVFEAIFDNDYILAGEVEERVAMLICLSSDVDKLKLVKGAAVAIGESSFRVLRHEPDGTGMSRLILRK